MAKTKTTAAKTVEQTPVVAQTQVVEQTLVVEQTPVVAQAPVVEQAPVVAQAEVSTEISSTETDLITSGRVKWFNNKAGYGFITVNDCETNEERDMFVHHSEIKVDQSQYKYLVQGEYVEFVVGAISRENKVDVHATNVRGINGGKLMCETRNETRSYRSAQPASQAPTRQASQAQQTQAPTRQAQQTQAPTRQARSTQSQPTQTPVKQDLRRPQLDKADQSEWMVVPRRRADTIPSKQKPRQRQPAIEIAQ